MLGYINNPLRLYLLWIIILLLFSFTGIPLLSIGHAEGEEVPATLLGHTIRLGVWGFVIISLMSPLLFWRWFRKNKYIPLVVPILILTFWIIIVYKSHGNFAF